MKIRITENQYRMLKENSTPLIDREARLAARVEIEVQNAIRFGHRDVLKTVISKGWPENLVRSAVEKLKAPPEGLIRSVEVTKLKFKRYRGSDVSIPQPYISKEILTALLDRNFVQKSSELLRDVGDLSRRFKNIDPIDCEATLIINGHFQVAAYIFYSSSHLLDIHLSFRKTNVKKEDRELKDWLERMSGFSVANERKGEIICRQLIARL